MLRAVLLRKRSRPGDADRGGGYPPGLICTTRSNTQSIWGPTCACTFFL